MKYSMLLAAVMLLSLAAPSFAASMHDQHMQQDSPMHMKNPHGPATQDYLKAMDHMHGPMMEGIMDADPDVAFVRGMIPHHQGAVEMAKIQLKYGKDPELRKLAQDVIDAQEKEMRFMEEWLKKRSDK